MAAVAVAVVASACSGTSTVSGTATRAETSSSAAPTTSRGTAAPSTTRVAPRDEDPAGVAPTIADYIAENDIEETPIYPGDADAPLIDLPYPEGWQDAGPDTPEWAYGAIIYDGPGAEEYTPSIVALVSRLTGDVDEQEILDHAPGELSNLPGWEPLSSGRESTLDGFPAYQLGGTWVQDGVKKVVAQKTVVIPGDDSIYVLQLNADGLESQVDIVGPATDVIDDQTTITP